MRWWIRYGQEGKKYLLGEFSTRQEAYWSFMMEGDRAYDYGKASPKEKLKKLKC
jgi:hypothetical protein